MGDHLFAGALHLRQSSIDRSDQFAQLRARGVEG
jgi:hypothetical protein